MLRSRTDRIRFETLPPESQAVRQLELMMNAAGFCNELLGRLNNSPASPHGACGNWENRVANSPQTTFSVSARC